MSVVPYAAGGQMMSKIGHGAVTFMHRYATDPSFRASVNAAVSKGLSFGRWSYNQLKKLVAAASRKRKRIKQEPGSTDPQAHGFKSSKMPPIGVSTIFGGAEVVQRPLSLKLADSVYIDALKAFLANFYTPTLWRTQFALQYVSDDQVRSCHAMMFRHRRTNAITNIMTRLLRPSASYLAPVIGGVLTSGLPYNFFDATAGNNMKCMVAPINMMDIEQMCARLTPPAANFQADNYYGNNTGAQAITLLNSVEAVSTTTDQFLRHSTWTQTYNDAVDSAVGVYRTPSIIVGIKRGGVKLFFENKHPVGSFVEIVLYKVRRDKHDTMAHTYSASGPDSILGDLENQCGIPYVDNATRQRAVAAGLDGKVPSKSDVTTNPYYPLLPANNNIKGAVFAGTYDQNLSEKKRLRFALASGHKRNVNIDFGGLKYDPRVIGSASSDIHSIIVVVAVNGQTVSAFAEKKVNSVVTDQLITGDIAAGHNMFIRGEYYEYMYPLKVVRPKTLFSQCDLDPKIYPSGTGITYSPYQILGASTAQRGDNNVMEAGVKVDNTDGEAGNDEL